MTPLKIGIISFAHVHAPAYAGLVQRMADTELVAIADDDEARGREAVARDGGDYHRSYQDLLARDDIDAVIVTAPNVEHRDITVAAARAGKHVLCEKPIATTRPDALAMISACRDARVKLQIAFPMRFSPPAIALREAVRAGAVGTPLMVQSANPGWYPGGWFGDPQFAGGGAVIDHTVHIADMLRWIFEREITSVYAEIDTRIHPDLPTDDVGMLMLGLDGGLSASLEASWARPGDLTMDVIGDKGVIALKAFNQNLQLVHEKGARHRTVPWSVNGDPGLIRSFVDAIRNDTVPLVTGDDGLRALEVALCAYESARRREPVACPDALSGDTM